jgi:hypothetical protein
VQAGRGAQAVRCSHSTVRLPAAETGKANIWFAAHECMVHEMPKAFGQVALVMIDEAPLDAFMLGTDSNDAFTLELDALRARPGANRAADGCARRFLTEPAGVPTIRIIGRHAKACRHPLQRGLCALGRQETASRAKRFSWPGSWSLQTAALEWRGKVEPDIRPDMARRGARAIRAGARQRSRQKLVTLWGVLGDSGRVQLHRGKEGRLIRMVGLRRSLGGRAHADLRRHRRRGMLRTIWPQLRGGREWQQLPRPAACA